LTQTKLPTFSKHLKFRLKYFQILVIASSKKVEVYLIEVILVLLGYQQFVYSET